MRSRLRLFVLVGVVATGLDIGILMILADSLGRVIADLIGLGVASTVSYGLNREVTFRGDRTARWVSRPLWFFSIALGAALIDLALLLALDGAGWPLLVAKVAAVGVAGVFRWSIYRRVLLLVVRRELAERVDRPELSDQLRLSVVIPAYNEAEFIEATIQRLSRELDPWVNGDGYEIVVADDGSTDQTADVAERAGARVVRLEENRGKGAAVKAGMIAARGRSVVFTDADLAYPPEVVLALLGELEDGWDMVVGSRRHADTNVTVRARRVRDLGGRAINLLTRIVLLGSFRDTQCGIKGFRRDIAQVVFQRVRLDGFAFDVELFLLAEQDRLSVKEVPVQVENRAGSSVRMVRDTLVLLADLMRLRRWAGAGLYLPNEAQRQVLEARMATTST